jgi:hypothetical protein
MYPLMCTPIWDEGKGGGATEIAKIAEIAKNWRLKTQSGQCLKKLKALTFISEREGHMRHRTCKPNSVRCCHRDGHSSRPVITDRLKRPTRKFGAPSRHAPEYCYSEFLPYLVLLRVGFAMPRALLPGRCALTAPFHPYRTSRTSPARRACACFAFASGTKRIGLRRSLICGGIFSVALSVKLA